MQHASISRIGNSVLSSFSGDACIFPIISEQWPIYFQLISNQGYRRFSPFISIHTIPYSWFTSECKELLRILEKIEGCKSAWQQSSRLISINFGLMIPVYSILPKITESASSWLRQSFGFYILSTLLCDLPGCLAGPSMEVGVSVLKQLPYLLTQHKVMYSHC